MVLLASNHSVIAGLIKLIESFGRLALILAFKTNRVLVV